MSKTSASADFLTGRSLAARLPALLPAITQPVRRVPTGWPALDQALREPNTAAGGFVCPSLVVIGGEPKVGKSLWTQILAQRWVERSGWAHYHDFENGARRFAFRLASRLSSLGSAELSRQLDVQEEKRQERMLKWFKQKGRRLIYEESREITTEKFLQTCAMMAELADGDPLLMVLDSVQKLPIKASDRRTGIDTWLRCFEQARSDYDCVIMLVSELHRPKSGKEYKSHGASYKESGDIEYTADLAGNLVKCDEHSAWFDIAWNRDGEACRVARYVRKFPHYDIVEEIPKGVGVV